jgi:DNA end-binding protein Ku
MAARSLASLTISFGLVSIPVKIFTTAQSGGGVSFNYLHKDCGSRLKQQYVCIKEDVRVERADMVKGFEFAKDQYVTFEPDELKELEEKGTGTVEITEFVPEKEIDPLYYEKAYYVAPDKGGAKPYALLAEGMRKTHRCALARWAARGKQYLVQLRPMENGLIMQQLRYSDEVKPVSEIEIESAPVKAAELDLAVKLIEQISADAFNPADYEDAVKNRITEAVEKKVQGKEISISPAVPESGGEGKVIDLMDALRGSLAKTTKARQAPVKVGERKPPKRATVSGIGPARARAARR